MGKRSSFERVGKDKYFTPAKAVPPLIPHLGGISSFVEPCAGNGALVNLLQGNGLSCVKMSDIEPDNGKIETFDALDLNTKYVEGADAIITNPPWSRHLLHPMIERFSSLAYSWLLFDADWMHTVQASRLLDTCVKVVSVGRLKWIEDSKHTGKDNCAWYLFDSCHTGGPVFVPRGA